MTWQPIETSPNGYYKTIESPKGDRKLFVPEWCFVMNKGIRHWTYRTEGGRLNGMTAEEIGDCWHPAPTPPEHATRDSDNA